MLQEGPIWFGRVYANLPQHDKAAHSYFITLKAGYLNNQPPTKTAITHNNNQTLNNFCTAFNTEPTEQNHKNQTQIIHQKHSKHAYMQVGKQKKYKDIFKERGSKHAYNISGLQTQKTRHQAE